MISEELRELVDFLKSQQQAMRNFSIKELRVVLELGSVRFPLAPDVRCEPVDAKGIPAEWISTPESIEGCIVFYLHGGGYVAGSVATHREMASRLSRAAKAQVLTVDYRLAPENPFPAAVEDSVNCYRWLLSGGADPSRIVMAGDSAGGGLTVATLVALREDGDPLPAAAVLASPWADLECLGESMVTRAGADPLLQKDLVTAWAGSYLGDTDPRTPLASPIYADLAGLPPMLIQVGTSEILFDDARRLAERAAAAGVNVTLEPWDDMVHLWHMHAGTLPEGQQAIDRIGEFVRSHSGF